VFTIGRPQAFVKGWQEMMQMVEKSKAGSWWLAGVGLALTAAGALFTLLLWLSYQRAEASRHWTPTPATVVSSQVLAERATPSSPTRWRIAVKYDYTFAGQHYTSTRFRRVDGSTGDEEKVHRIRQQFTPGADITCWVNPADPQFAILQHDTRAALYTLWFPLLFFFGGLRMSWAAWTRTRASNSDHAH
jgi:hypothetical protein